MTKPVLLIQLRPEDEVSDSEFEAILKYGVLDVKKVQRLRIEKTGIPTSIQLKDYSAIIVGGSPFDISKLEENKSAIQIKIEQDFMSLLDKIVDEDFPFLGVCSGNGLLGKCLGAPISTQYGEKVSCVTLTLTAEGKQDTLLSDFPDQINVMLGHKEACDELPEGATLLIEGEACPVQMFRIGRNVYATQFHPEADVEGMSLRINAYKHHGYFPADEAETLIKNIDKAETAHAQNILKRFVSHYVK